ncbi:DUF6274 family protein [Streptomyces sp. MJM1172]|uniref:DUF6274 family protein n=1 Tax=Streptomyces sp. MJM1172 TaxID=1703926 RepID=UPI003FD16E02
MEVAGSSPVRFATTSGPVSPRDTGPDALPDERATGSEARVTSRDELRALLKAHLRAAGGRRHLTRHRPACHRLQRLALTLGREGENPPSA